MAPSSEDDDLLHDREFYSIPSSSSWFQWDEIAEEERRALPEFFQGASASRNPRIYKEYRDFIINKYREDPARRLTFTDVRKSLVGDVGHLHKVFAFLDQAGLINFSAEKEEKKAEVAAAAGTKVVVEEGPPGGIQVVPAFAPRRKRTAGAAVGGGEGGGGGGSKLPPLTSYSDVFGDWMPQRPVACGLCGDHNVERGNASMMGGVIVCSKCSDDKSQIEVKTTSDLNDQADAGSKHPTSAWTDSETLLLLEAVLKHGDDWDLIAQHVRTKTKLDCITRLIHLPFAEHMLGTITGKCESKNFISQATDVKKFQLATSETPEEPLKIDGGKEMDDKMVDDKSVPVGPSKKRRFPAFLNATDSLMNQVARLSTVAGPQIAGAAAQAAVTAMCDENPCARMAFDVNDDQRSKILSTIIGSYSELKAEDQAEEAHKQNDTPDVVPGKNFGAAAFRIRAAIATALGATAARAKLLADNEDREIELLMASIIEAQLRKIRYKIKHFEELEVIMEKEYTLIQETKENILDEWVKVLDQAFQAGLPRFQDRVPKPSLNNSSL